MADVRTAYGATTALTVASLSTLAYLSYATSAELDFTVTNPLDCWVDVSVTVGTVASNKQLLVFAVAAVDGVSYSTANSGSTDATHDANMYLVGVIPTPTASETVRRSFTLAQAFGGRLPPKVKLVIKNDTGAALTAGSVQVRETYDTVG